jgi:hypothetical protein
MLGSYPAFTGSPKGRVGEQLRCRFRCTFEERKQVSIALIRVSSRHAMWQAGIEPRRDILKQLG